MYLTDRSHGAYRQLVMRNHTILSLSLTNLARTDQVIQVLSKRTADPYWVLDSLYK